MIRFQAIAPISAAPTDQALGAGRGVDDALADGRGDLRCRRSAPTRLATAAMTRAIRGVSARVETEVGDRVRRVVEAVGVVEPHRQGDDDRCGNRVHGSQDSLTAMLSTVFATFSNASAASSSSSTTSLSLSTVIASTAAVEQLGEQPPVDLVGLVLEPVDLDPVLGQVVHRPQPRHRLGGQLGIRPSTSTWSAMPGRQLADPVEHDQVDRLLHEVHAVVEAEARR